MAEAQHNAAISWLGSLPTELRCMIWRACLADEDPSAVYLFTPRWFVWCEWEVAQGIYKAPQTVDGQDISKARLIEVSCPTQLLHVSRESRRAVMRWADQRQYMLFLRKETGGHIFVRHFIPKKDTLFMPHSGVDWLRSMAISMTPLRDPYFMPNPIWRERFMANWFKNMLRDVEHIALPAATICDGMQELIPVFLARMQTLQTLSAIMADWPQALPYGDGPRRPWPAGASQPHTEAMVQPRWELEVENGPNVQITAETSHGGMFWGEGPDVVEEGSVVELLARAREALHKPERGEQVVMNGWVKRMREAPDGPAVLSKKMVWKSPSRCRRPGLEERQQMKSKRLGSIPPVNK